jgi:hypothetical protein
MFATVPGTELTEMLTVADLAVPSYVTGELLTASVAVGVRLLMVKAVALDEAALLLLSTVTDAVVA